MIDSKSRNRILFVLFIGVLMGALDIAIVGPALPAIRQSFGVDDRSIAWVFTVYVLFDLISVPFMAKMSDLYGRRTIYMLDVALFAFGSLIVALSSSLPMMLVGRMLQGSGAGGVFPVASAVIGDTFPPEKRGSALGMIGMVFGVAFLVGPILAGIVLLAASWHWLFIINLPIAAIVIVMASRVLPGQRPAQQRTFDLKGMAVLAVLLASLTFGVNQLDTAHLSTSLTSITVWPFLLLVLILIPVFLYIEVHVSHPILPLALARTRQVVIVGLVATGAGLGEAAIVFVPALVVAAFGTTTYQASFMLIPAVLAMGVGSPTAGRMLDRNGSRVVLLLGTILVAAGMIIVALFGTGIFFFYASAVLVGLGLGMLLGAPLRYVMLNEAPPSERASAQGVLTLYSSTGQLIGGAMVGAVAASLGSGVRGYSAAFLVVGLVMAALMVLTFGLKSRSDEIATARVNHPPAPVSPEHPTLSEPASD